MVDWAAVDRRLEIASTFVLTPDERKEAAQIEQTAFETNLPHIQSLLNDHRAQLDKRGFRTELPIETAGFFFRYWFDGFYGPGGFRSMFHVSGPLVVARLVPRGDETRAFYQNDVNENVFLGERFDELAFAEFIRQDLMDFLAAENQILSREHYEWVKDLAARS